MLKKFYHFLYDPDPPEEKTGEVETEPKEEPKEEPKAVDDDLIEGFVDMDGNDIGPVSEKQARQLIALGYDSLQKKAYSVTEPVKEEEPDDVDARVARLEAELKGMKEKDRRKQQKKDIYNLLAAEAQKYELTKNNPKMAKSVEREVIAMSVDPQNKFDFPTLFKRVTADRMEAIKTALEEQSRKTEGNSKIDALLNGAVRGGGGLPSLETDKKWTPQDVFDGKSRNLLAEILAER